MVGVIYLIQIYQDVLKQCLCFDYMFFNFQVRFEKYSFYIYDEKDSVDLVVVKIKFNNCVVKDWIDVKCLFVMEIRRMLGRFYYLQVESELGMDYVSYIC